MKHEIKLEKRTEDEREAYMEGYEAGYDKGRRIKSAEWIYKTPKSAECSNCGHLQYTNGKDLTRNALIHKSVYHYCPNCGAKMKEESERE